MQCVQDVRGEGWDNARYGGKKPELKLKLKQEQKQKQTTGSGWWKQGLTATSGLHEMEFGVQSMAASE